VIDGLAAHLLGRHVARRADDRPRDGFRLEVRRRRVVAARVARRRQLGDAESRILIRPSLVMKRLSRFDVAVDDLPVVRGGEALRNLRRVFNGFARRQCAPARRLRSDSPSSSSETMYGAPSWTPVSWTTRIFG